MPVPEIVTIGTQVNAAQNDLPVALADQIFDLLQDLGGDDAAPRPAGDGDDTEGAPIVAAVLDLEESPGARAAPRREDGGLVEVGIRFVEQTLAFGKLEEAVLVGVADHQIHTRLTCRFGCQLNVATGGHDCGAWVAAFELPDELA